VLPRGKHDIASAAAPAAGYDALVQPLKSAFNRLKDFRRIATRYDRLARNYLASVCLAAALAWWI
jgi:transposase